MYRNPWNRIRLGRVLEDLDSMAGNIAFVHTDDGDKATIPPMLVTAAVERIQMLYPVAFADDVVLSGQVVYTGSSSLDIRLTLGQAHRPDPSIIALVTFVARDPQTGKATRVNPLVPQTEQEVQWFEERAEVARQRKAARKAAGGPEGPLERGSAQAATQRAWARRLLTEARAMKTMPGLAAGDALLMDSTRLSNTFTCQPQQRNMHGRVFGGFLMRRAYELAFATVHMFAGSRPRFVQVDRVDFKMPVDVGDLLSFRSCIMHARNLLDHPDGARGQIFVQVEASVNRPEHGTSATTNTFSFTFETDLTANPGAPGGQGATVRTLKRVLPATEQQACDIEKFCPRVYSIE
eukprot:jgi/Ulvmu1/12680/UM094_0037.1